MAAGDIKQVYGSASQGITCTLASLASSATAAREATVIDNTSNLFDDALVYLKLKLQTGTPANDKAIYVYFYCSEDGSNYTDNVTGADAAVTLRVPTNLFGPFIVQCPDSGGLSYKVIIPSVAGFFGGRLPPKWGIVIRNYTGIALDATEGNHTKEYRGIYRNVAA
jgi:hypothetical protein